MASILGGFHPNKMDLILRPRPDFKVQRPDQPPTAPASQVGKVFFDSHGCVLKCVCFFLGVGVLFSWLLKFIIVYLLSNFFFV